MELRLYDTLTREKRVFRPIDPANVRMYVCGPTVYDFAHIGNARPVIVFDVLFRLLRHLYGAEHVTYVRNVTDVDDKINARAVEEYPNLPLNNAIRKVTTKTEKQFHDDVDALHCLRPTVEPRATEHIEEMKLLIDRLVKTKRAYVLDDHVIFSVKRLKSYGKLSHRSLNDMRSSARGEVAPKKYPMDFVLWKPSKPGEPAWPSPARIKTPGRPGWHIECSAMADKWLWTEAKQSLSSVGLKKPHQFDIHGGGIDLLFPHHENERAQTCRAFNKRKMAQFWMHNEFLRVEGEKMAKSIGNFYTINELLDEWGGSVLRLTMLKTHYRRTIDWTHAELKESGRELSRWADMLQSERAEKSSSQNSIVETLFDDLNTPNAITYLRQCFKEKDGPALRAGLDFLGLGFKPEDIQGRRHKRLYAEPAQIAIEGQPARLVLSGKFDPTTPPDKGPLKPHLWRMLAEREIARSMKNFVESDRIRDELAAQGIVVKDTKDGTTWEIAR